ncbi:hypothetical protein GTQ43_33780 [Nostoc sp. KVJ3]|uniref:NACHT domain-containing protein n=1 Tax=Nostoc sp. KVJ3 TaxID=457945 RepID=UPI00223891D3|nr:hypothetical protein [Nostoc sp. KVJ3]MCW5318379.1 hypothetical protein [Nostoc sp. KVJ3]MCW5318507.1 hypothetical protein [Nostoc sp. KVJ3]
MSQPPDNFEQQPDVNSTQQADSSISQNVVQGNQNRAVQGNDNQAVLGDGNTVVQGNNNLMFVIKELIFGQQTTPVGNPERPKNERILLAAVKEEVTARLRQSLHNAVLINLGKESQPQQVKRPWDAEIKIGLKPAVPLSDTTTILEVFDSQEIAGKLLILGEPGAGKTTTQLELARELIKRAEEQPDYPVPILLNLSSWQNKRPKLEKWLISELKSKYGVRPSISKQWLESRLILPMLDGLDEVSLHQQPFCVEAINQFLKNENRPPYLVVCSRIENYNAYTNLLLLNGAISLHGFTNSQIQLFLERVELDNFWNFLHNNSVLLELLSNPLLLSVTILVFPQLSENDWKQITSSENFRQRLLDAYIHQMFTRSLKQSLFKQESLPTIKETCLKLCWVAQNIQLQGRSDFLIEDMQPDLLSKSYQKVLYRLILVVLCGIIGQFISWVIILLVITLNLAFNDKKDNQKHHINSFEDIKSIIEQDIKQAEEYLKSGNSSKWLVAMLIIAFCVIATASSSCNSLLEFAKTNLLVFIYINEIQYFCKNIDFIFNCSGFIIGAMTGFNIGLKRIETLEYLKFPLKKEEFKRFGNGFIKGFIYGLSSGISRGRDIVSGFIILVSAIVLIISLIIAASSGFWYLILIAFLVPILILILGLVLGLALGLVRGFILGLILGLRVDVNSKFYPNQGIKESAKNSIYIAVILIIAICIPFFSDALVSWILAVYFLPITDGFGGLACIQHLALRITLWQSGYIPWNYARFLNYCTERLFLQRVGGRYRFIHKLLQDHFAQMEFKRN